jgi:hypothetical protein
MPRYSLRTASISVPARRRAVDIAARRFPEIAVEADHEASGDGTPDGHHWVCRAPSPAHVRRWAAAADLHLVEVQPIAPSA